MRRPPKASPNGPTRAHEELEDAQDSLDEEADSLEESIEEHTEAAARDRKCPHARREAVAEVAQTDPELAGALRDASTCQRASGGDQAVSTTDWILLAIRVSS